MSPQHGLKYGVFFLAAGIAAFYLTTLLAAPWSWLSCATALYSAKEMLGCEEIRNTYSRFKENNSRLLWWLLEGLCLLILLGISYYTEPELLQGLRPFSQDHPVHFTRVIDLKEQILSTGSLFGWSPAFFAGFGVGYDYPILSYLIVLSVEFLTFGFLDTAAAYASTIFLTYFLISYATYQLGKFSINRTVGLLAAVLSLFDFAGHPYAGLYMYINYGVWPFGMALAFSGFTLLFFLKYLKEPTPWLAVLSSLFIALSLFTHQSQIFNIPLLLTLATLISMFSSQPARPKTFLSQALIPAILGAMMAAPMIINTIQLRPFLHFFAIFVPTWKSFGQIVESFFQGSLYPGTNKMVEILGLAEAAILFFLGNSKLKVFALIIFACFLISSPDFYHFLFGQEFSNELVFMEISRFRSFAKIYLYLFTAAFLYFGLTSRSVKLSLRDILRSNSGLSFSFLIISLILSPFIINFFQLLSNETKICSAIYKKDNSIVEDRESVIEWLNNSKRNSNESFRVAVGSIPPLPHLLVDLPSQTGIPVVRVGFIPTLHLVQQHKRYNKELFRLLNVRYYVSFFREDRKDLQLVELFGRLKLYEFAEYNPTPYQVVEGSVVVSDFEYSRDLVKIRVAPDSKGKLALPISYLPLWKGYQNGKEIKLSIHQPDFAPQVQLLSLEATPGDFILRFEKGPLQILGLSLFWAGVLVCLILIMYPKLMVKLPLPSNLITAVLCLLIFFSFLTHRFSKPAVWQVEHFNGLSPVRPAAISKKRKLGGNWHLQSPHPDISKDNFMMRWTTCLETFKDQNFVFTAASDDGIRLILDNETVIDDWSIHHFSQNTGQVGVSAGKHLLKVEHFDKEGQTALIVRATAGEGPFRELESFNLSYPANGICE